ncbi:toxin glutamine deamidase domain-containing protein [Streptomyces decoyicus]|uniref:toxin glutamine deamidase domain-containing protein n=1 Tax=Streptomyces decoyicus TaxID=249567 RepID=UPI00362E0203
MPGPSAPAGAHASAGAPPASTPPRSSPSGHQTPPRSAPARDPRTAPYGDPRSTPPRQRPGSPDPQSSRPRPTPARAEPPRTEQPRGDESSPQQPQTPSPNKAPEQHGPEQHGPDQSAPDPRTPDPQHPRGDDTPSTPDHDTKTPEPDKPDADKPDADKPDADKPGPDSEHQGDTQPHDNKPEDHQSEEAKSEDNQPDDVTSDGDSKSDDPQADDSDSGDKDPSDTSPNTDTDTDSGPEPESHSESESESDSDSDSKSDSGPDPDPAPDSSSKSDAEPDTQDARPSTQDIRSGIQEAPGGLLPPDPADQQALVDAIPRNDDGTPQRFPDPFGDWAQLQNDGGTNVPGRSNNCADCSRSFLDTWYGNPQVSAPRTPDLDADGNPDRWSPETAANENIIDWTGAPHSYAGTSPDGHAAVAQDLLNAGPGSSAIVQVNWDGGGGHAFNAVNHDGRIVWVDTQSGEVSEQPINTDGATDVFYIPLDADRNPLHPAQDPAADSDGAHSTSDQSDGAQSADSHPPESDAAQPDATQSDSEQSDSEQSNPSPSDPPQSDSEQSNPSPSDPPHSDSPQSDPPQSDHTSDHNSNNHSGPDANDPATHPDGDAPGQSSPGNSVDTGDTAPQASADSKPDSGPDTSSHADTTPPGPDSAPPASQPTPDSSSPTPDDSRNNQEQPKQDGPEPRPEPGPDREQGHEQSTSLSSDAPADGSPGGQPRPVGHDAPTDTNGTSRNSGDTPPRDGDPQSHEQNRPAPARPDTATPGTPVGRPDQTRADNRPQQSPPDSRPQQSPAESQTKPPAPDNRPKPPTPDSRPKPPAPDAPAGKRKASGPPPTDNQPSGSGAGSSSGDGSSHKKKRTEPDHEGLAALKLDDSPSPNPDDDAMDVDQKAPYSDPHDRGDSDTSEQEQKGDRTLDAEAEGSKEYGIPPDKLQNELRRDRDVHRVPLDNVHDHLDSWAKDGSLAQVLRASTGDAAPTSGDAGKGPRAFTQSDLEQRLPGFKDLERGERLAVVSSLARLSVGFHEQHGVGKNPENVDKPYRKKGEDAPKPESKDSAAKDADESLGVRGHRKSSDKLLNSLKLGTVPPSLKNNSPDLTDRNYAVLEVEGPPPARETHYVTDSSVPVGEKYVSGRHSEKHLADWLKRVNQGDTKYTPQAVYTEREPCGMGQGHAKCSTVLREKALDDAKVYYSTTYRTDPADVAAKKKLDTAKTAEKKKVDSMAAADVQQNIADRINARTDKSADRAAKEIAAAQNLSEADARKELKKLIEREYSKRKEDSTTEEKQAMVREMDRHIDHLDTTWRKIQPSLM